MSTGLRVLWYLGKIALIIATGGIYCVVTLRQVREGVPDPVLMISMSFAMLCILWMGIARHEPVEGRKENC